jgi:hypothetical protein
MTASPYLDLLSVTPIRPTQNGRQRHRYRAKNRALLLQVREAFDALGVDKLSTGALLAYLDDTYPDWRPRSAHTAAPSTDVRASHLAKKLATHDVPLHRGIYNRRKARGVWRVDVDRAVRRAYLQGES